MQFLKLLLGFAPWIAFLAIAHGSLFRLKLGLAVAAVLTLVMAVTKLHRGVIMWVGITFFTYASIAVLVFEHMWTVRHMGVLANGALAVGAWATLAVNSLMMLTGLWLLRTQDIYRPYQLWCLPEKPQWSVLRHFLRLGVPAGLSIMVEVTSFTLMALFIARLGAVASASHQIAASLASVLYMVPLALGIASSARTGYWLGAGQARRARHAAGLGIGLAIGAAVLCAAALLLGREAIAHAFTNDPLVAQTAMVWLAWVAVYHLTDAVQAVCAFLLRCYRITIAPLLIYTAFLWGFGLYGGYLWAYDDSALNGWLQWTGRPAVDTFWISSSLALAAVSALFAALVWRVSRPRPSQVSKA